MAETASYLRPGNYIGFIIRPSAASITGYPRLPVFVGKGSRLARYNNYELRRSYISDEALTFTGTGPYTATLTYQSDGNKNNTELVDSDGTVVDASKWEFSTAVVANDQITMSSVNYDATTTYYLSYQSLSRVVQDDVPYANLREVTACGRGTDSKDFTELVDFFIPVTVTDATADSGNTYEDDLYGTVNGNTATAVIAGANNEDITFTAATAGVGGNGIHISVAAGVSLSVVESVANKTITVTYVDATSTTTAIVAAAAALTLGTFSGVGLTTWATPAQDQEVTSSSVDADGGNTLGGMVYLSATAEFTHVYSRDYEIECTTGGDSATAEFAWSSSPLELGNDMETYNPPHTSLTTDANFLNAIVTPGDDTDVTLEYGIKLAINDNAGVFTLGDKWTFRAFAAGAIEQSALHENSNQFTTLTATADSGNTGTGTVTVSSTAADYTGDWNRTYTIVATAVNGTTDVDLAWSMVGDDGIAAGTQATVLDGTTVTLDKGVTVDIALGASNFVVTDKFTVTVLAPRVIPEVKDDRDYTFEVSTAVAGDVDFIYNSGTPEGGTGIIGATTAVPEMTLDGNLVVMCRNIQTPRFAAGDTFTFTVTLGDVIDWSLKTEVAESIDDTEIITDTLGRITGTAGNYYVVLNKAPTTVVSVIGAGATDYTSGCTIVTDGSGDNTRYLDLGATSPAEDITVTYQHIGNEPAPGEYYRFSGTYLRGSTLYNDPILIQDEDSGRDLLYPMSAGNHLAVINEIAWQYSPAGFFVCQVQDADDDGTYQTSDYDTAIEATESEVRITDMVVLSSFSSLSTQLQLVDTLADPYQKALRLVWVGCPVDTAVGDAVTSGSVIYTAINTCAVYGDNPAHGTRIMVAPTWAKYTVRFENGTTQQVTLDGSFVAAAMCLHYASFGENPWMTVLRKNLNVFDEVETFTDSENKSLGAAQVNWITEVSAPTTDSSGNNTGGVYQWEEDMTTDATGTVYNADEFRQINAMMQKKYVVRAVDAAIESAIISLTPEDPMGGAASIRNTVASVLRGLVGGRKIGRYVNSDGKPRKLNPSTDIKVYRDPTRPTVFRYYFAFYIRNTIKHTYGLALVDSNNFGVTDLAA